MGPPIKPFNLSIVLNLVLRYCPDRPPMWSIPSYILTGIGEYLTGIGRMLTVPLCMDLAVGCSPESSAFTQFTS